MRSSPFGHCQVKNSHSAFKLYKQLEQVGKNVLSYMKDRVANFATLSDGHYAKAVDNYCHCLLLPATYCLCLKLYKFNL